MLFRSVRNIGDIFFRKTSGSKTYSLFGGIVHRGGANSGHHLYITYQNDTWYSISDDKVFEMTESQAFEELEINATLLGYQEVLELNPWRIVQNKKPQESYKKLIEPHKLSDGQKEKFATKTKIDLIHKTQTEKNVNVNENKREYHRKNIFEAFGGGKKCRIIFIEKPENSFYDKDKCCFYRPRYKNTK